MPSWGEIQLGWGDPHAFAACAGFSGAANTASRCALNSAAGSTSLPFPNSPLPFSSPLPLLPSLSPSPCLLCFFLCLYHIPLSLPLRYPQSLCLSQLSSPCLCQPSLSHSLSPSLFPSLSLSIPWEPFASKLNAKNKVRTLGCFKLWISF